MSTKVIDLAAARAARGLGLSLPPGVAPLGAPARNRDCEVHDLTRRPFTLPYIYCRHCGITSTEPQPLLPPRRRFRLKVLETGPAAPEGGTARKGPLLCSS
jgi:hypothetical protein